MDPSSWRLTIADLRRHAVGRSLFPPTSLQQAIDALGFVQADPIRSPARAQDLILRHRVAGYRAGDLERHYASLAVHEDTFINYGFVSDAVFRLMHPRRGAAPGAASRRGQVRALLEFVRSRGQVHPREVDAHFSLGTVTNYWGGSSSATTHLLDLMHYRGLLRVVRRDAGIRVYGPNERKTVATDAAERRRRLDALVDVAVNIYAPLPAESLAYVVRRLRYAVPQWSRAVPGALQRAKQRLAHVRVGNSEWYWPSGETPGVDQPPDAVRLLAPFDPVVWDRRRFELLWHWPYRFEAYTPIRKRQWGYYALPVLWRATVIGWANASATGRDLTLEIGYVAGKPRDRRFDDALARERERFSAFLALQDDQGPKS